MDSNQILTLLHGVWYNENKTKFVFIPLSEEWSGMTTKRGDEPVIEYKFKVYFIENTPHLKIQNIESEDTIDPKLEVHGLSEVHLNFGDRMMRLKKV